MSLRFKPRKMEFPVSATCTCVHSFFPNHNWVGQFNTRDEIMFITAFFNRYLVFFLWGVFFKDNFMFGLYFLFIVWLFPLNWRDISTNLKTDWGNQPKLDFYNCTCLMFNSIVFTAVFFLISHLGDNVSKICFLVTFIISVCLKNVSVYFFLQLFRQLVP